MRRLRDEPNDALLVRSGQGFVRTQRGERIHASLRDGLQALRRALLTPEFHPSTARHTIAIAAQDVVGVFLLPALLRRIATGALASPEGEGLGVVDRALAAQGRKRRIAYRTRYFIGVALAVAQSDLLLTMPARQSGPRASSHCTSLDVGAWVRTQRVGAPVHDHPLST